jgi:hypothetical protein
MTPVPPAQEGSIMPSVVDPEVAACWPTEGGLVVVVVDEGRSVAIGIEVGEAESLPCE